MTIKKQSCWIEAERHGVDTSLLEMNLRRSPTERVLALQDALAFADELMAAGKRYYARLQKTDRATR